MFGIAKKIGMTRLFVDGKQIPVTAIKVAKSYVLQKKTVDNDGYNAVQLGAVEIKNSTKPEIGHAKKYTGESQAFRFVTEFKIKDLSEEKKYYDINDFSTELKLDLTGVTIGKGFTGAVKRWGFAGQPASHGHDHERAVGSIGSRWPQRVVPGKKMAGHHGAGRKTLKNVQIVAVDMENELVFVHGSIPGANGSYVEVKKA